MEDLLNERDLGGISLTRQYARQLRFSKRVVRVGYQGVEKTGVL